MSERSELVRMQLLLSREDRDVLEDEARRLGVSMSEVVRRAVRTLREEIAEYDAAEREKDPFFSIIGIAGDLGPDASTTIDDVLYGPLRES